MGRASGERLVRCRKRRRDLKILKALGQVLELLEFCIEETAEGRFGDESGLLEREGERSLKVTY